MLTVQLFGRFEVRHEGRVVEGLAATRAQELCAYLALYRGRPHTREALAGRLWSQMTVSQSKKALRQALWQVRRALNGIDASLAAKLLVVDGESVHLVVEGLAALDVDLFELAATRYRDVEAEALDETGAAGLRKALDLYRGHVLEGWYHEWCLAERDRLQGLYAAMLDKLLECCAAHGEYRTGLEYGGRMLGLDRAHERTYRQMMRLHYLAGDRTAALREYERCRQALAEELDVEPRQQTIALYREILADGFAAGGGASGPGPVAGAEALDVAASALDRLREVERSLEDLRQGVRASIQTVEAELKRWMEAGDGPTKREAGSKDDDGAR